MDLVTVIGTVIGIAAVQIFRDMRDGKHPFKKNGAASMYADIAHLKQHYNEDLTKKLEKQESVINEIKDTVRDMSKDISSIYRDGVPCKRQ